MNKNVIDAMNSINSINRLQDEAYLDVHNAIMESQNKYEIIKEHGTVEYAQNEFYQESVLAGVLIGLGVIGLIASTILIIKKVNETSGKGSGKGTATPDKPAADMNLFESKSIEDKQKEFNAKVDEILKKIGNTDDATRDRIFEIAKCNQKLNGPAVNSVAEAMDKVAEQLDNFANKDPNEDSYVKDAESIIEEIEKLNKSIENSLNSLLIDIPAGDSIADAINESFTIAANISGTLKKYDDKLSKVEPKLKALSEKAKKESKATGSGTEGSDANNQNNDAALEALQKRANNVLQPMSKDNYKFFETIRGLFNNIMSNVNKADYSQLTQKPQPAQESQPTQQSENQPAQTQGAETPTEETSDNGAKPTTITVANRDEENAEKWATAAKESEARANSENNTRETTPVPVQQTATPEQPEKTPEEIKPTPIPGQDKKEQRLRQEIKDLNALAARVNYPVDAETYQAVLHELQDDDPDRISALVERYTRAGENSEKEFIAGLFTMAGLAIKDYLPPVETSETKETPAEENQETAPAQQIATPEQPETEPSETKEPPAEEKPETTPEPAKEEPKVEETPVEEKVDEGDEAVHKLATAQGVMLGATLMSLLMTDDTTETTEKVAEEVKKEEETVENVSAEEIQKTAEESNAAIVKEVNKSTFNIKSALSTQLGRIKNSEKLKTVGHNIALARGYFADKVETIKASKTAAKHKDITDAVDNLITTLDKANEEITSQGIEVPDGEELFNNIEAATPKVEETPVEQAEEPKDEKPFEEQLQSIATAFGKSVDEVKADYDKMHTGAMSKDEVRAQIDANVKDPRTQGYYKKIFKLATGDTVNGTIVAPTPFKDTPDDRLIEELRKKYNVTEQSVQSTLTMFRERGRDEIFKYLMARKGSDKYDLYKDLARICGITDAELEQIDSGEAVVTAPVELEAPVEKPVDKEKMKEWKVEIDNSDQAMYVPVIPTFSDPAELVNYTRQIVSDLPQLYKQCIDAKSINNAEEEVNINNITYKKITPNEFEDSTFMALIGEFTGYANKLITDINAAKKVSPLLDNKLVVMGRTVAEVLENLKSIYGTFEMWYAQLIRFVNESYNFTALDKSMDDIIKELRSLTTNVPTTREYVDRVKEFRSLRTGKPNTNKPSELDKLAANTKSPAIAKANADLNTEIQNAADKAVADKIIADEEAAARKAEFEAGAKQVNENIKKNSEAYNKREAELQQAFDDEARAKQEMKNQVLQDYRNDMKSMKDNVRQAYAADIAAREAENKKAEEQATARAAANAKRKADNEKSKQELIDALRVKRPEELSKEDINAFKQQLKDETAAKYGATPTPQGPNMSMNADTSKDVNLTAFNAHQPSNSDGASANVTSAMMNMNRSEMIDHLSSKYNTNPADIENAIKMVRDGEITQDDLASASAEHPELADYYSSISFIASGKADSDNNESTVPPITVTHNQTPETVNAELQVIANRYKVTDDSIDQIYNLFKNHDPRALKLMEGNGPVAEASREIKTLVERERLNEKLNEQPTSIDTPRAATPAPKPEKKGLLNKIKSIFTKESYEEYILPSGEMTMVLVEYEITEYEDGSTEKRRIRIINE